MRIVIIGGVAAGMSAAAKAKRVNKEAEVVVYERTKAISWGACGMPYYVGDFYKDPQTMVARTPQEFAKSGVEVKMEHEVLNVDPVKKELCVKNLKTGEEFIDRYDNLMIATGARAIIPPIKNLYTLGVHTLKEFTDALDLKIDMIKEENQNIVIIGAGYIGLEVVEAAKNLKKKSIRIIQHSERILKKTFDKEITDLLENHLQESEGVDLHLMEDVEEIISKDGKVVGIKTNKGEYKADIVVVATGVKPNTEFLDNTGINRLSNGAIVIDEYGRTSIDSIYSAGDCATVYHRVSKQNEYIPLATTANKIGRTVGENLAGKKVPFQGTLGSAAIKVLEFEAARTGITEEEAKSLGIDYKTVFVEDVNQAKYYPGQEEIYIKLIYDNKSRVILGAQITGKKGAALRIDALATAIFAELTVDQLGMLDFSYAPPFAPTWDSMNVAGNLAK